MEECDNIQDVLSNKPEVYYNPAQGVVRVDHPDPSKSKQIHPRELRLKCRCAACVDEMTGTNLIISENIPEEVYPTNMISKGNYAVAVVWSDGHNSSIYSYEYLLSDEVKGVESVL